VNKNDSIKNKGRIENRKIKIYKNMKNMKKKIIYFCAGVLLTSLILVAIQTFATAPNPGHDASEISGDFNIQSLNGKNFYGWDAPDWLCLQRPTSGHCGDYCASQGMTCLFSNSVVGCPYNEAHALPMYSCTYVHVGYRNCHCKNDRNISYPLFE